jgi:hypothetical protein
MESSLSFLHGLWITLIIGLGLGFTLGSMAHWNLEVLIVGPLICLGLLLWVYTRMVWGHNPSEWQPMKKLNPPGILHGQNGSCWRGNWECRGNFQFASNHLNYSNILYEIFPMWSWRKLWTRAVIRAVLRVHDRGSQENRGTSFSYVLTMVLNIWNFLKIK